MKTEDPTKCCLQEIHFNDNAVGSFQATGYRNKYHADINQKKAMLTSEKVDFDVIKKKKKDKGRYNDERVSSPSNGKPVELQHVRQKLS